MVGISKPDLCLGPANLLTNLLLDLFYQLWELNLEIEGPWDCDSLSK